MLSRQDPAPAAGQAFEAFEDILLPGPDGTVIVAVSGGSDSTALLVLLRQWLAMSADSPGLHAVTVDHGLRAASAEEAGAVARLCAGLGVSHETLCWDGPKPSTGRMAAAREARYRLLDAAAQRHGARLVMTGHTQDDQAETIAMRAARGPGIGLAGIAPASLYRRRTWFVRPLIGLSRAALRRHLIGAGTGWIDDPTNTDLRNERARVRAAMPDAEGNRQAASLRIAGALAAARLIDDGSVFVQVTEDGAVAVAGRADAPFMTALCHVITHVARRSHLPGRDATARIAHFAASGANGEALTVHGCLLRRRAGAIHVTREGRNRGGGSWGADVLLALFDHPVAAAIDRRLGRESLPPPPFRTPSFPPD